MTQFNIGDCVRVRDNVMGSEFIGSVGIVVAIEQRRTAAAVQIVECEVEFAGKVRRRFIGFQLQRLDFSTWNSEP